LTVLVPSIQRIAPALPGLGEVIRGNSCH
jgi:hypothetical protein